MGITFRLLNNREKKSSESFIKTSEWFSKRVESFNKNA